MINLRLDADYDIDRNLDRIRIVGTLDERYLRGLVANWDNIKNGTGMTSEELYAAIELELQHAVDRATNHIKQMTEGTNDGTIKRAEDPSGDASGFVSPDTLF